MTEVPSKLASQEYPALLDAADHAGLDPAGAELVSLSSRAMWHLPTAGAAVAITRPNSHTHAQVLNEARAVRAARTAEVRTPGLLGEVIELPGERYALTFEWLDGARPAADAWPEIAAQAAHLAAAPTKGIQPLHLDPDTALDPRWTDILGPSLASSFAQRRADASREVDELAATGTLVLAHGDLQPANVLVDQGGDPWLLDFECASLAPIEWDAAKITILANRFGDPHEPGPLLQAWPSLDPSRLARCVTAQEVLIVGWLVQMAIHGTANAADEAPWRAETLDQSDARWHHLR